MASTLGHALCGISCLLAVAAVLPGRFPRPNWQYAVLFMALANLPDIDFLLGYLVASDLHAFHQGPTHSLLFAGAVGLLLGFAFRRRLGFALASAVFALTTVSHIVIDALTGPNLGLNRSPGIALLWPFNPEKVAAPFTFFPSIHHQSFDHLVSLNNVVAMIHEAAVFLPLVALLLILTPLSRRAGQAAPSPGHHPDSANAR